MEKFQRLILPFAFCAAFASGGVQSLSAQDIPPATIYGFMASSDEWRDLQDQAYEQYGYYSFKTDGSEPFKAISPIDRDQLWATCGGVYADDCFFGYAITGTWSNYTLHYTVLDASTWKTITTNSFAGSSSQKLTVPSDLAYDAINNVFYASTRNAFSDQGGALCSFDPQTGKLTKLGDSQNFCALTADAAGNLFGIAIEDGGLYQVAKDGSTVKIGDTGFFPVRDSELIQSATYDFATSTIYWSMYGFSNNTDRNYNRNGIFAMVRVDPATAKSEITWTYPRDQRFSSINILNAHPYAPADVTDLTFKALVDEGTDCVVSFTVPSRTSANVSITDPITVNLTVDQTLYSSTSHQPGSTYTREIKNLPAGAHNITVECINKGFSGNRVYASTFVGTDVPAAVENLTLSAPEQNKAQLTWSAPTTGKNGSTLDQSKIRYRIQRYPDNVTVARSLNATSFTETIETTYGPIYYIVTPYHVSAPNDFGSGRRSNTVMIGGDIVPPYTQSFATQNDFNSFTTIDANGDGGSEWTDPCWKWDPENYCAFYYGVPESNADDWLITPPIKLDPTTLYRLTFKQHAYYGYGHHFTVTIGDSPTVEGQSTILADIKTANTYFDKPGVTEEILFAPAQGERFIGFHHISENMEQLYIHDITIEPYGDSRIPAAITDLSGVGIDTETLMLMFTAPSTDAAGNKLTGKMSIEISRDLNSKPVATLNDVEPGSKTEWTDTDAILGLNSYVVRAVNSYGNGLIAEITVDLTPKVPEPATNAVTRYINDRQVEITWQPSTTINEPGDEGIVRYLVHRIVSSDEGETTYPIIGRDLTECRFVDDDPRYGMEASSQQFVQYYVSSVNGAGMGVAAPTTGVYVGEAYQLPFAESWAEASESTGPWTRSSSGATWYVHGWAYDPYAPLEEGTGLLDCEVDYTSQTGTAYIFSPRLDLTSQTNPTLHFSMWTDPVYGDNVRVMVGVQKEGQLDFTYITSKVFLAKSDKQEWVDCSLDLSEFGNLNRASIVLVGVTNADQRIHITKFRVEGSETREAVRGSYIVGNADLRENDSAFYSAYISNAGATDAKNVNVEIVANGKVIETASVASVAAGARGIVRFTFKSDASHIGTTTLGVVVKPGEGYTADSTPATKELRVIPANYSTVADLGAKVTETSAILRWGAPHLTAEPADEIDGFEAYSSFAIDSIGGWTTFDGDGLLPFRLQGAHGLLEWPGCDAPQAFMVFNPEEVASNAPFQPFTGRHAAMCFGSPYGANNDWLISPELTGEAQLISFYASAMRDDTAENFHFLISRTDNNPASFVRLNGKNPISCSTDWDIYHFTLPEGTRYFAINYVGESKDGLMIDDVRFISCHNALTPDGYNIYRDGVKVNDALVLSRNYIDEGIDPNASYVYTVRPVFNGNEGGDSNECIVRVAGISGVESDTMAAIYTEPSAIVVEGATDTVEIYTTQGRLVAKVAPATELRFDVTPGIYIVSAGTARIKVVVK